MSLSTFSILVAIDENGGIAKDGKIPWKNPGDMKFFRELTYGRGNNAVIMGRITYETIPPVFRPLKGRVNVVVSRTWKQEDHPEISVCSSLLEALKTVGSSIKKYDELYVIGGEQIYNEALNEFLYLCRKIYVTKFKTDYDCDQFFPWEKVESLEQFQDTQKTQDYVRYFLKCDERHEEYNYLDLLFRVSTTGEKKRDRTSVGTRSLFGSQMEFDISERLPVLTTKKLFYNLVFKELLFFISGKTDSKLLEAEKVNIWKGNTSREFLNERGLEDYDEGDIGPLYGFNWRHWGAEYQGADKDYVGQGIDQLQRLIDGIRDDPYSRRHVLSNWNVSCLDEGVLEPCHVLAQFNVSGDGRYLDCQLYQRSGDMFLGVPFNILSYCTLTYMIAHIVGLKPRRFVHTIGDTHVYNNHAEQVSKQLKRTPLPFPSLKFRRSMALKEIDDFEFDSFILDGYKSWPKINAEMAI